MAKITGVSNGESGASARSKINTAIATVETDATLSGDGNVGTALSVDAAQLAAADIKTVYESNADTNEFSDAEQSKLAGIEASATADQTGAEIKTAYEAEANTNAFTDAEQSKLSGIEASADVTDAANVDAAGAVMESDATTASMSFVIDDDTMATASDTTLATSDSIKQYVLGQVSSQVSYEGGYNASTNTPDLDTTPSGISKGEMYTVTVAGNFFTIAVEVGDVLISEQDSPTLESHWTVVNKDLNASSIKTSYESNADTNAFTDADHSKLDGIEASADVTDATNVAAALGNGLEALTTAEVDQLENINSVTVSNTQWGYLGASNQGIATTDAVTFAQVNADNIRLDGNTVSTTDTDGNFTLAPDGAGTFEVSANTNVTGAITATGNMTTRGDLISNPVAANADAQIVLTPTGTGDSYLSYGGDFLRFSNNIVFDNAGNVGIGNVTPTEPLEVYKSTDGGAGIFAKNDNAGSSAAARVLTINDVGAAGLLHNSNANTGYGGANSLNIGTFAGGSDLALVTANVVRATVDTNGNLGVGTQSPSAKVHVEGGSTKAVAASIADTATGIASGSPVIEMVNTDTTNNNWNRIYFTDAVGGAASVIMGAQTTDHANDYGEFAIWTRDSGGVDERFRIDSAGSVGIGESAPDSILHIKDSQTLTANDEILLVENTSTGNAAALAFEAVAANGGTGNGGAIYFDAGATGATSNNQLQFNADHQSSTTPDMVIDGDGDVGIGNSAPTQKLHVGDGTADNRIVSASNSTYQFQSQNAVGGAFYFGNTAGATTHGVFSNGGGSELMRIENGGNVGIGTTSPTALLHTSKTGGAGSDVLLSNENANVEVVTLQAKLTADTNHSVADVSSVREADGSSAFTIGTGTGGTTAERLRIDSSGNVGIGLTPTANMAGLSIEAGVMTIKETTTPTADTGYGKIYAKADNKLYFQDGAGTEHEIAFV